MRVFVTGGSGFIGGHLIEGLASRHDVLAMARSDSSAAVVERFGAQAIRCDLGSVEASHLGGCEAVFHSAAFVGEFGPREAFERVNVNGTRRLLEACAAAGVKRFIHVGTEAMLFDGHDLIDVDESALPPTRHRFLYSETKAEAERLVLAANRAAFNTLSIRPRMVWGPRDATILPAVLRMLEAGSFAWVDQGRHRTSTTHIHNLVHALLLALERGNGGNAYFVADDEVHTVRQFLTALVGTAGLSLPERSVPGWAIRPAASAAERMWGALGLRGLPPVTRLAAAFLSASVTVNTAKARQELGYEPVVDFERGLQSMA